MGLKDLAGTEITPEASQTTQPELDQRRFSMDAKTASPNAIERRNRYPGYPERSIVPDDLLDWRREFKDYNPTFYESAKVIKNDSRVNPNGWADPQHLSADELRGMKAEGRFKSFEGEVQIDLVTGRPLNPFGRMGLAGRGTWGHWGANFAADNFITREDPATGRFQMLVIRRRTGEWAMPGGMVDPGENPLEAARRELQEEASERVDEVLPTLVYQGYTGDPRNTDNAWAETSVFHFHLTKAHADKLPRAGSDAADAKWINIDDAFIDSLFANHKNLARIALTRMRQGLSQEPESVQEEMLSKANRELLDSIKSNPVVTSFYGLKGRIGIFGGTYDPVHLGHLQAAKTVMRAHNLDGIIMIPAAHNPLKDGEPKVSAQNRMDMLVAAVGDHKNIFVSPLELRRQGNSYSVDTLTRIREEISPDATLFLIVGADCLPDLHRWRNIDRIRHLATVIPHRRAGTPDFDFKSLEPTLGPDFSAQLETNYTKDEIQSSSSTLIREKIGQGILPTELLPEAVVTYIQERRLYRTN